MKAVQFGRKCNEEGEKRQKLGGRQKSVGVKRENPMRLNLN